MAIAHEFQYTKPKTLDETLKTLQELGKDAMILAGATDLAVQLKEGVVTPGMLVDIKGIDELNKISFTNNQLRIGASVTFSEIMDMSIVKKNIPMLSETASTVASVGVRNRATIVGNLCSAVPSLDAAPVLLVYEASVIVRSLNKERKISILDWFLAPRKTALGADEMVTSIEIPIPKESHSGIYTKLGRYKGEDLAQAGVGVMMNENKIYKIAFCALGPIPKRSEKIESILNGNELNDHLIDKAVAVVPQEIAPITDIRSTKEYRTHMTQVMLKRSLIAAQKRLNGELINVHEII